MELPKEVNTREECLWGGRDGWPRQRHGAVERPPDSSEGLDLDPCFLGCTATVNFRTRGIRGKCVCEAGDWVCCCRRWRWFRPGLGELRLCVVGPPVVTM